MGNTVSIQGTQTVQNTVQENPHFGIWNIENTNFNQIDQFTGSQKPKIADRYFESTALRQLSVNQLKGSLQIYKPAFLPELEWDGVVEELEEYIFVVRLMRLNGERRIPTEFTEFNLTELSNSDQSRIQIGSIVRWAIGIEYFIETGKRQTVSRVYLRHLRTITKEVIKQANIEAKELIEWFNSNDPSKK